MTRINEPVNAFRDINNLISCVGTLEIKERRIHQMPKSDAIRSASRQASFHVWTPAYSLSFFFTMTGLTISEYPFKLIKKTTIALEDLYGFEIVGNNLVLYIQNHEKYDLSSETIHINFEDIDLSSEELIDTSAIKKHYRKERGNLISADRIAAALIANGFECEVI